MGIIKKFSSLTALLLLLSVLQARAQDDVVWSTPADSMAAAGIPVPDSLYRGFNALEYSMQRRYRPVDEVVYHKADLAYVFGSGKRGYGFLSLGVETDYLFDSSESTMSRARGFNIQAGKRFHVYNAWRVDISASQLYRNSDYRSFLKGGLSAEHNFYIVSYLNGFKRLRPFDLYTVEGIGADVFFGSSKCGEAFNGLGSVTVAPYLKLGLGFQFKFGERTSLVLSPQFNIYPSHIVAYSAVAGEGNIDARAYHTGFNLKGGLQIDLGDCFDGKRTEEMRSSEYSSLDNPTFISFQAGLQFQNGKAMWDTGKILNSLKESASISLGKWMYPYLAIRGSLYYGRNTWKQVKTNISAKDSRICQYSALRTELMLDPFGFKKGSRRDVRFSLPVIFGLETGMMQKKDTELGINRAYVGYSTGLQLKYAFSSREDRQRSGRYSIFLEPHCSFVPYTFNDIDNGELSSTGVNYWDAVISLTLGLEISLGR